MLPGPNAVGMSPASAAQQYKLINARFQSRFAELTRIANNPNETTKTRQDASEAAAMLRQISAQVEAIVGQGSGATQGGWSVREIK